jgi:glycosyltransferase involved in cell wall biosynthesis
VELSSGSIQGRDVRLLRGAAGGRVNKRARRRYDVAFYVPWIGPLLSRAATSPTGGAETQIFLLARALAGRGSKVCLLVFDLPGIPLPASLDGVAIAVRPPYLAHEPLGKLRETVSIRRTVVNADADLLVTRAAGPEVGLAGLFAKLSGRRFIYSSANVSDFEFHRVSPKRLNRALFRLGIHLADEIVVQTAEQARLCQERFGRSPVVIKSIAEPAEQRDQVPEAFLWIGRLIWYKRPLAFVELARSLPEAKFRLVGVPDLLTPGALELARELERRTAGIPNLELLPPRPRRELMDLVDSAVAVVNTADFEGMPNIFLEGWARGVPALSLMHDPDQVIERHQLGAFAHGSPAQFVEAARTLWNERRDQTAVAARCRQYVLEHHSQEAVSARWQETFGLVSPVQTAEAALAP